jgi:cytochrome c oxidase subunit 2
MIAERAPGLAGWPPSALDPAGPFAGPVLTLSWVLFGGGVAVLALVVVALGVALFGPPRWRARLGGERLVWIGGLAFPVVVLSALLIYGLGLTSHLADAPRPGELRVRVTGEMWWWRVAYLDGQGREVLHDANEVHIPAGRPVVFELDSADVIHSFWVPRLGGKKDMIPGRRNLLRLQADAPGAYGGQCAEYCGGPHALMGLVVVAHAPAEFEAWRARQARPAPAAAGAMPGAAVFAASGCGACHTVRGSAANGLAGPDLTHVGSRRTLGAGILPNNQGALAGWVADGQAIKPGNRMPAYPVLNGQELRAVAAYLESLK